MASLVSVKDRLSLPKPIYKDLEVYQPIGSANQNKFNNNIFQQFWHLINLGQNFQHNLLKIYYANIASEDG